MVDKSIIGTELGKAYMRVELGKVREFGKAVLDDESAYATEDPPIPPTFTMASAHWPPPEGAGAGMSKFASLGLDMLRILHAGQEFEYLKPVKVGDELTAVTKISDLYEKEGRKGGTLIFLTSETTWRNQSGEDVLISRTVLVQTSKAAS